ncbi:hypothetical protein C1I98_30495 [Spongiactinospora gelatinilytica]|uniref:Uncharacterized protein n=1 Tax=Spongiactinospora gelatinilytica TaxID=2666298 RepID=A0A2W2FM27_9ACTN|nr:hypothetical protein [Spongiactinospora gelatinilytica]PZG31039.1 hypothetical protein C1I98_30495 [Spongiactinospora gelatinilytica]
MFFLVMLLLGAVFTTTTVGGVLVGLVGTGVLVGVLARKYAKMADRTVIRFSPLGVELEDGSGFRARLAWGDITRVGEVQTRMASPRTIGRPGGMRVRAGAMHSLGLIGWGERAVPQRIPARMRQQLAAVPVDQRTGRPEVSIPLGAIDPAWQNGDMGNWVARYRPDLMQVGA